MHITALYVYPIKSLGGISLTTSEVEERGLTYDRRWVLADKQNMFITQRQHSEMAFFEVSIEQNGLRVFNRKSGNETTVPFEPQTNDYQDITVWDDTVKAVRVSDKTDAWFTAELGFECSLFYQPDGSVRPADSKYSITGKEHVSMADGYPILVVSQASLDDLNARIGQPMELARFRPNVVIEGCLPFEEDDLREIKIGDVALYGVKPCARCVLTTIDPATGTKGAEPLKTLATFRKSGNKIKFGQNVVVHQTGSIAVGDELKTNKT